MDRSWLFPLSSARKFKNVITGLVIAGIPALLVFKEPDLGNALSILAIWGVVSIIAGFKLRHATILVAVIVFLILIGFEFLSPYQKNRIESFANPNSDPLGTGYNVLQSQIAAGSGGIFGKGLGKGSQSQLNFLPEAESDFIFASFVEQLGFLGAALLLSLYIYLIYRILSFDYSIDTFSKLLVTGTCSFMAFQFFVNVGMNLGLLPVTGITLPLVSYGGSSLVSTLFLLGIVSSIKRYQMLN
ncbi:FtsW/RodA/SpoVE family cell cycle protein [Candidatus Curtissbacteria bacterium]|nr:FtsW/RodA/SpoVE family cell cycle protein [Candidatus Curtissbacteria bacterium]